MTFSPTLAGRRVYFALTMWNAPASQHFLQSVTVFRGDQERRKRKRTVVSRPFCRGSGIGPVVQHACSFPWRLRIRCARRRRGGAQPSMPLLTWGISWTKLGIWKRVNAPRASRLASVNRAADDGRDHCRSQIARHRSHVDQSAEAYQSE